MDMEQLIPEGFGVSLGYGGCGWFGGAIVRPDRDKSFVEDLGERDPMVGAKLKPGQSDDAWEQALLGPVNQQIILVTRDGCDVVTTADGIWGPAAAKSTAAKSLLSWTEKVDNQWKCMVWHDDEKKVIYCSEFILTAPSVADVAGRVYAACQLMSENGPEVLVINEYGRTIYCQPGRSPKLIGCSGKLGLVFEQPESDRCSLQFIEFRDSRIDREIAIPAGDDLNLKPDITVDDSGTLYVTHEACPVWGHDHFLGRHRDLYLWKLEEGSGRFVAAPGRLAIPYRSSHSLNEPPVQPRVFILNNQPAIAFRRFEYWASRPFSWHVYLTRFDGATWSRPTRISDTHGVPEVDYGIMEVENQLLTAFTCCESRPPMTWKDLQQGREPRGMPGRVHNTFVKIQTLPIDTDFGPVDSLPNRMGDEYHISLGVREPAPNPAVNRPTTAPKQLVWGDLHQHTLWSKCMSPVDGTREENLRYQRDILGCRVFSFGEHTTMMSDSEFTYYLDQLEAEAGADGVVLYGTEPWSSGHDTNLYAIERDVFIRLRTIYQRHRTLEAILNEIKKEFPNREVACIRHFHGGGEGKWLVSSPEVVNTFILEIEPAMEAMQVRGNVLLGETDAHPGLPAFPANFLNAGCRLGLVGGTDHSGSCELNHFCLTGFWVDELTRESVWRALWDRKTIALSNGKISIWTDCSGALMGDEVECNDEVRFKTWLSSARNINRVTLLRDGEILGWQPVNSLSAEIELVDSSPTGNHWYSITAEAESSPDLSRPVVGHSSPIFVKTK